jgi:hypothetical protein
LAGALACTNSTDIAYEERHLPSLVLTEAPDGTVGSSLDGPRELEDLARDDEERRQLLSDAGFHAAYESTFKAAGFDAELQGFHMTSRAYLFEDPDAGIDAIRSAIEQDGDRLVERAAPFPDRAGFALRGVLDGGLPAGIVLVWRKHNVVELLAVVAVGAVSESELRSIARHIDGLEPAGAGTS